MMRRIRICRAQHSSPTPTATAATTTTTRRRRGLRRGRRRAPLPPNEQPIPIAAVAFKNDDVAGVKALLFDEAAPALSEHVALATIPVRVTEAPELAGVVFEGEEQALVGGVGGGGGEGKVFLGILLGDDEAVELANVAGSQGFLEHGLLGEVVGDGNGRGGGGFGVEHDGVAVEVGREMVNGHIGLEERERESDI